MVRLHRIRDNNIPAAFRGSDRIDKTLQLLKREREIRADDSDEGHKFPSNWSPTKSQLLAESNDKCAYCESPTTVIAYGDVEHYRPKSKYWWLAYCYDNYLPSCTLCNQKYKKAKFDIEGAKLAAPRVRSNSADSTLQDMASVVTPDPLNEHEGQPYNTYTNLHLSERPLLINPYIDEPSDFFAWEVDHVERSVYLIPLDPTDDLNVRMVAAAEKDYGINRKELCAHRYDAYLKYTSARLMSEDADVPQEWRDFMTDQMNNSLMANAAYLGMVLFFNSMASDDLSLTA